LKVKEILCEIGIGIVAIGLVIPIIPYAFFAALKEHIQFKHSQKVYMRKFQEENR